MRITLLVLALALFCLPLAAQTTYQVTPAAYANKVGTGAYAIYPFYYYYKSYTYQQICDDMVKRPGLIKGLSLRRHQTGNTYQPWTWTADITLGQAPSGRTSANMSSTFANNMDANVQTKVSSNVTYNFNFTSKQKPGMPQPWEFHFPFTKSFFYPGAQPLVVEYRVPSHTIPTNVVYMDTVGARTVSRTIGKGYKVSGQKYDSRCSQSLSTSGSNFRLYGYGYYLKPSTSAKKEMAWWIVGSSKTQFGPLTLPFDLAPFGFTGQNLYTDVLTIIGPKATGTSSNGYTSFSSNAITFPTSVLPPQTKIYGQIFATDGGAPNGVFFTSANEINVPLTGFGTAYAYKSSKTAGTANTATSGSVTKDTGHIIRLWM